MDNAALNLDGWLSKNYVDAMNGTTYGIFDPRLPLTASLTKFNDYRGTRNGGDRVGTGTNKEEILYQPYRLLLKYKFAVVYCYL